MLWLTPDNPFAAGANTSLSYSFGPAKWYAINDPESSVDRLLATSWNAALLAPATVPLPNGDTIAVPHGVNAEQAAGYVEVDPGFGTGRLVGAEPFPS
jgi:hypothetical protein